MVVILTPIVLMVVGIPGYMYSEYIYIYHVITFHYGLDIALAHVE